MSSDVPTLLDGIQGPEGLIEPDRLGRALQFSAGELATAVGLPLPDLSTPADWASPAIQARLREFILIAERVLPWCGSAAAVMVWFRSQPLPSFGGQTASDLIREGRGAHVLRYLDVIDTGGYA